MTDLLFAIDGTGAWSNDDYRRDMQNSFVNRIFRGFSGIPGATKFYHRGPSLTGMESSVYGLSSFIDYLQCLSSSNRSQPINVYITGYSRGAMIAVYLANRIHQYNALNGFYRSASNAVRHAMGFTTNRPLPISIAGLMLFDAVDSDITMWGPGIRVVPASCTRAWHFICKQSSTMLPRSRWYFNRIDLEADPASKLRIFQYDCTHAAIGGLPGTGDHRTPASLTDVVRSGLSGATDTSIQAWNPTGTLVRAAGNFASSAAGTAWDSLKSNITLEQDMAVYATVNAQVSRQLGYGRWPVVSF